MWQESSQLGQPAWLLVYPVYTCDAMPGPALNQYSVLFGNSRRSYLLVNPVGMRVVPKSLLDLGQLLL